MAQSQRTSGGNGGTGGGFDPVGLIRSTLSDALSTLGAGTSEADVQSADADADGAATDGGRTAAEAGADEPAAPIDFTGMEPEEALYALLCREGGKMKQSAMVTETGWSKSKVSRRLSNLEETERIGRVRQGREKVVFVKPGSRQTKSVA